MRIIPTLLLLALAAPATAQVSVVRVLPGVGRIALSTRISVFGE